MTRTPVLSHAEFTDIQPVKDSSQQVVDGAKRKDPIRLIRLKFILSSKDEIDMITGIVGLKDKCIISLQLAHFTLHGVKQLEQLVQLPFHLLWGQPCNAAGALSFQVRHLRRRMLGAANKK